MYTQITENVKVSVETVFQPEYSNPENDHYMFIYRIKIQNLGEHSVQLLGRHWWIFDSCGVIREVEGEGVVGEQPVIEPGEFHEYVSGCNLKTDMGAMWGNYLMFKSLEDVDFKVEIPKFQLVAPYRLN